MRAAPAVAAEVLLALIIEDEPYRKYRSYRHEIELGLEFAHEGYPAIFWKSPFFPFLSVAPNEALGALIALVNFCTERWADEVKQHYEGRLPAITLHMADGATKDFIGNYDVFDWTQASSMHNAHLFSALDALERWLALQIDAGTDIASHVERLLRDCNSASIIGLLVSVGKYRSSLFTGVLLPVLTSPLPYAWDTTRVDYLGYKFPNLQWAQSGAPLFEMARDWTLAPHRQQKLFVDDGRAGQIRRSGGRPYPDAYSDVEAAG